MDRGGDRAETLVDEWDGRRLNPPNDVAAAADGAVWFTDPSYGHLQGFRPAPQAGDHVHRHEPWSGRTEVAADSLDKPNGLAFSPDERVLYVADSGADQGLAGDQPERPHGVVAFDVVEGRRLAGAGCSPSRPAPRTGSRSTPTGGSTSAAPRGCRCSRPTAASSARSAFRGP